MIRPSRRNLISNTSQSILNYPNLQVRLYRCNEFYQNFRNIDPRNGCHQFNNFDHGIQFNYFN